MDIIYAEKDMSAFSELFQWASRKSEVFLYPQDLIIISVKFLGFYMFVFPIGSGINGIAASN